MDRKYSDKEMRAILDKAISLQAGQQGTYSKQQIEQIGEELGLSGDLIERAAREIDIPAPPAPAKPRRVRFIGAPAERDQVMRVERILSDEEVELLVDTFCSVTGAKGKLRKYGKHWGWNSSRSSNAVLGRGYAITIRNYESHSEVEVQRTQRGLVGGLFGGIVGGVTGGFGLGVRDSGGHSHRLSAHRRCGAFGNLPVFLRACIYHIQWRVIRLG
jgi:hypothetical protein